MIFTISNMLVPVFTTSFSLPRVHIFGLWQNSQLLRLDKPRIEDKHF